MTAKISNGAGDKISTRQVCFILAAYGASTKLLLYPSLSSREVGNALIFSALINIALQAIIIWAVSFLSSRTDKTFFQLLSDTFGKVTAKVIYALFALYFVFSAIVPLSEQQLLVYDSFYDTIPSTKVFLPIFIFTVYAGVKRFTNVGRCADICLPVFVFTAIAFLAMSVGQADYTNLLPLMDAPAKSFLGYTVGSVFRFSESAFLLMFMGHYKHKKGDTAKLTLSYIAGGLFVVAFIGTYFALYSSLAHTRLFAISNISLFFPIVSFIGRIDLFEVYMFDLVVLFAIVLNVQMCVHCLCHTFGKNYRIIYSLCANAVLITLILIFNGRFAGLHKVAERWFWIPAFVFAYLIPLFAWALKRKGSGEGEGK